MISTVPNIQAVKKGLLKACYNYQTALIHDLSNRISEILRAEGLGNEEEYDNTSLAHIAERTTEADLLGESLKAMTNDLKILQYIRVNLEKDSTSVGLGSVVLTRSKHFYISVSIGDFEVDGVGYTGISMHSPLSKAMQGKTKGEKFFYKGHSYTIKNVY